MDLTKITTPYGLLDEATQKALRECGGPWELYTDDGEWVSADCPQWMPGCTYRLKPQPPKPREWWVNVYPPNHMGSNYSIFDTLEKAQKYAQSHMISRVHVREVFEP